jgi:hypothetical protein
MKRLIATALIACVAIGVLAWVTIRHLNNKQDAEWCHDNGYTNYATKDGFCVGAGGKLVKVGRRDSEKRNVHPVAGVVSYPMIMVAPNRRDERAATDNDVIR